METLALVKPTPKELLLNKIEGMQKNNLTAVQKEKLAYLKSEIVQGFKTLTGRYFGLNAKQILELPDKEIEALFLLVRKRARKTSFYLIMLGLSIPIFGWAVLAVSVAADDSVAITFTRSLRKFKKMLGHEFNPIEVK
ncbi:MAG: hypothetical protein HYT63_00845 [Candidatus Yanofskybacteria bacterium]|nr:hypothetical protein [Candidatus Yanofskybacteria bacterium]